MCDCGNCNSQSFINKQKFIEENIGLNNSKNNPKVKDFWKCKIIVKWYLDLLFKIKNFDKMDDWYKITNKDFVNNYGKGIIDAHIDYKSVLIIGYPRYDFIPWLFKKIDKNYWENFENHKKAATWLGEKLRYKNMNDWYKITNKNFKNNGLNELLKNYYNHSSIIFVKKIFQEKVWFEPKFNRTTNNYWTNYNNRIEGILYYLKENNITNIYDINGIDIGNSYLSGLCSKYYSGKYANMFIELLPDKNLLPWKFNMNNCWNDDNICKSYLKWLGEILGYNVEEDWYNINLDYFNNNYGGGLTSKFNNSPSKIIMKYIDYEWLEWKFKPVPSGFWTDLNNQRKWLTKLGEENRFKNYEDYYKISSSIIEYYRGNSLLYNYYNGSPSKLVMTIFKNDFDWDKNKFMKAIQEKQVMKYYSIRYLDLLYGNISDQKKIKIDGEKIKHVDGFSKKENIIIEFHGDLWHGNPKIYNPNDINPVTKKSFGELYNKTIERENNLKDLGYNLIIIWESEWKRGVNAVKQIQRLFRNKSSVSIL
tara:strand:+ start:4310 stop:5911 length:1602 start_codon:yes stop_codon:yes gene_type:complete